MCFKSATTRSSSHRPSAQNDTVLVLGYGAMKIPGRIDVDIPNAFIGKKEQPTQAEVSAVLGSCAKQWDELIAWLRNEQGVSTEEWNSFSPKYGWSLRLKLKKRNIVHLAPCDRCFRVAFILGDRAVKAALQSHLPKSVISAIRNAPRYPEGTGLRLIVKRSSDLPALRTLALIKLAN
jgi:hypothetical protein